MPNTSVLPQPEVRPTDASGRARISVCIASYNSGHYIALQLGSILPQLDATDEVVVVDDHSTDGTAERVRALGDARIRVIEHMHNVGVVGSFEHALRAATGELLFLADHDDLWAPNKLERFCKAFERGPEVQLVMSAVTLIDAEGEAFQNVQWDRAGAFTRGFWRNVVKNGYQGSSLAIRRGLLSAVLPLPQGRRFLHDAWIGTVNDRLGGGMVFLPEPLLLYRRHHSNVSHRLGTGARVVGRVQLLWNHLRHIVSRIGTTSTGKEKS